MECTLINPARLPATRHGAEVCGLVWLSRAGTNNGPTCGTNRAAMARKFESGPTPVRPRPQLGHK
jgi:hypothetical protein